MEKLHPQKLQKSKKSPKKVLFFQTPGIFCLFDFRTRSVSCSPASGSAGSGGAAEGSGDVISAGRVVLAWMTLGWLDDFDDFCGFWSWKVGEIHFPPPFFDVFFFNGVISGKNTLLAVTYIHLKWNLFNWILGFDYSIGFFFLGRQCKLCISTFCASRRASVCRVVVVMPRSSNSQASFKAQSLLSCIEFQEKTSLLKLLNQNMKQRNKQKIVRKKLPNSKTRGTFGKRMRCI